MKLTMFSCVYFSVNSIFIFFPFFIFILNYSVFIYRMFSKLKKYDCGLDC